MTVDESTPRSSTRWDPLVQALQEQRRRAGEPSYAAIAGRIGQSRQDVGAAAFEARVAKSTVHAAFAQGRTRIDLGLVREIASVLGATPEQVDAWLADCAAPSVAPPDPTAEGSADGSESASSSPPPGLWSVAVLAVVCVAANLLGREFVDFFGLPLYLDMAGTAVAAMALGPWRGAAVGATTNLLGAVGSGWVSLPFALVNVVGALCWGYGVRRLGLGRSLARFLALSAGTALACSLVAVPVIAVVIAPDLRVGHDVITSVIGRTVGPPWLALAFSNVLTSLADKLLSGFVALAVVSALPLALRRGSGPLVGDPPQTHREVGAG